MLWSLMSLFGKFVTPGQLPSHITSGKVQNELKYEVVVYPWRQGLLSQKPADKNTTGFEMVNWVRRSAWWELIIHCLSGSELSWSSGGVMCEHAASERPCPLIIRMSVLHICGSRNTSKIPPEFNHAVGQKSSHTTRPSLESWRFGTADYPLE